MLRKVHTTGRLVADDDKDGDAKSERLHMFISPRELSEIEDWQFGNRIRSKSDAIRRLVQIGLRFDSDLTKLIRLEELTKRRLYKFSEAAIKAAKESPDERAVPYSIVSDYTVEAIQLEYDFASTWRHLLQELRSLKGGSSSSDEAIKKADAQREEHREYADALKKRLQKLHRGEKE